MAYLMTLLGNAKQGKNNARWFSDITKSMQQLAEQAGTT